MHRGTLSLYFLNLVALFCHEALAQTTSPTATPTNSSSSNSSSTSSGSSTAETPSSSPSSFTDVGDEHGVGRWAGGIDNALPPNTEGGRTAFVPLDDTFRMLALRQAGYSTGQYLYQVSNQLLTAESLRGYTGSIIETLDTEANLGGGGQTVLTRGQRGVENACSNTTAPIKLISGLGNAVTIVEEDIPFDGGILHVISSPFTRPSSLSDSLSVTSETSSFASYISSQLSPLDSTESVTVFAPSNDAISTLGSNGTVSEDDITAFIDAHVVSGSAVYSPLLVTGARFQTRSGDELVVTAYPNGTIFLNDVLVIQTDIIVSNGVVHIIDRPLSASGSVTSIPSPTSTTPGDTVFTGAAGWSAMQTLQNAEFTWSMLLGVFFAAVVGGTVHFSP
ncbi:FAS1 domain-containing protein [Aspergillus tetrazonus]